MKKILVLVDFTETAVIAIDQAKSIAKSNDATITLCHVAKSKNDEDLALKKLDSYVQQMKKHGVETKAWMANGKLFSEVTAIVDQLNADLVVVGTHGLRGVRQNLFGADIYKLIKGIKAPSLVVNAQTKIVNGGFKKVILPVAAHVDYLLKVKQTCRVLSENGKIVIFAILKAGIPLSASIQKNITATKELLDTLNIDWEYQELDSQMNSIGYARETIKYSREQKADLISIMTKTSMHNEFFGKMDKESMLVNDQGVPVLCANC